MLNVSYMKREKKCTLKFNLPVQNLSSDLKSEFTLGLDLKQVTE